MDWFNRSDVAVVIEKAPLRVSELSAIIEGLLDNPLLQDILVRGELTSLYPPCAWTPLLLTVGERWRKYGCGDKMYHVAVRR